MWRGFVIRRSWRIEKHGFVLTPGRYVGAVDEEDDGVPFEEKMNKLVSKLQNQFTDGENIQKAIVSNLKEIGLA